MFWMTPQVDYQLLVLGSFLGGSAVLLLTWSGYLRRSGRADARLRLRRFLLGTLALVVFAKAYGFFLWNHPNGIQTHDAYHYYLNSKYFPELGYFELYTCTVAAFAEGAEGPRNARIRDLRNPRKQLLIDASAIGPRCNGAFSPERWRDFRADLRWFQESLFKWQWKNLLNDHGYNPSPIWTLIGRPVASLFPASDGSMRLLARIDLVLVVVSLGFVGWAFGFETLCLAALVFALNPLHRYAWIGDAFLRYAWLSSSIIGLCLLRKEKHFGAGVMLALASLLRLFPLFFIATYGLWELRRWLRERSFSPGLRSFSIGVVATSIVLPALAVPVNGRGPRVLVEFAENIGPWSKLQADNTVGLRPLLSYTRKKPEPELVGGVKKRTKEGRQRVKDEAFAARRVPYYGMLAILLLLLWRAVGRGSAWEAAALGFVPMLTLVTLPAYYTGCMVAPALLATRRPRIGIGLMLAMTAMCVVTLLYWENRERFAVDSVILLLVSLQVLIEMRLPARERSGEPDRTQAPHVGEGGAERSGIG